ncbi:MAG: type VI secretion system contractile sheath large subunit [Verrucomicrobiales bacterium]|nr:type VI secretion system contractile sheath large subunit [Verrucomicrobiales bacterium]
MENENAQAPASAPAEAVSESPASSALEAMLTAEKKKEWIDRVAEKTPTAGRAALTPLLDEFLDQLKERPGLVSADALDTIQGFIADIDARLARQVNAILHNPKFQQLEAAWRGLEHMVKRTNTTGGKIQIKVMNVRKTELFAECKKVNKAAVPEKTTLFDRVYTAEFNTAGGWPFGLLVGDFQFDHSPADVEILRSMARLAAASHAPFLTGVSPRLFGLDSWLQVKGGIDFGKKLTGEDYNAFNDLRNSEDASYVGLSMPRFLARAPYGPNSDPVEGYHFEEQIADQEDPEKEKSEREHDRFCWANAAYAMAANITRAFHKYRWCTAIRGFESGGAVENLPLYTFKTEAGSVAAKCATEVYLSDDKDLDLSGLGLLPLVMWKRSQTAAFLSGQSMQRPKEYSNSKDATANARLKARLPYLFAASRFAHYLKVMMRQRIGRAMSGDQIQQELNNWIVSYVSGENATEMEKRSQPLAEARVVVKEDPKDPGYYHADIYLRPHFQLEGLSTALKLVARMPTQK